MKKGIKVKVISGDFRGNTYEVLKILKSGMVMLKDLFCLNSKKKQYSWKIHYSNLKPL